MNTLTIAIKLSTLNTYLRRIYMHGIDFVKYVITAVFLYIFLTAATGSYSDMRFKRLTINDGLSLSSVYCIYQDSKGYMWFGTEDGLNKFDGKNFKVYRASADNKNTISYKWVEIIYEDAHKKLWFGSRGGLTRFDPVTEQFKQYSRKSANSSRLSNDTVLCLMQINEQALLVGTLKGLDQINLQAGDITRFSGYGIPEAVAVSELSPLNENTFLATTSLGLYVVNMAQKTSKKIILSDNPHISTVNVQGNSVWIGTADGLYYFQLSDIKNLNEQTVHKVISTSGIRIEQILFDPASEIWISSPGGLYKVDSDQRTKPVILTPQITHSLAIVKAPNLLLDKFNNIWYTTHGEGIYRINHSTGQIENFKTNPCDPESLSENSINCIYEDQTGGIWLGTFGAGISVFNPYAQKFQLIKTDPTTSNTLASNFVWTICEDREGRVWVGSNDNGISVLLPHENRYLHFNHEPGNSQSLSHSSVRKIYEDSDGIIWIGTDGGGLNRFNKKTNTFTHYKYDPSNPNSIPGNSVRAIYEDKNGMLWIGTRDGLCKLDKSNMSFKRYRHDPEDPKSLSHNFVYSAIHQDNKGNLWIGTYGGGLNKFNIARQEFTNYRFNSNDPIGISDDIVFSIHEDAEGILWIGTNSQLNRFNPATGRFTHFGIDEGLPNEVIYAVLPDEQGNLWLSTNLGVCRFNPETHSTLNYDVTDGLQSNEFNGGAYHKGPGGNLYFGGVYGLNIIDPEFIGVADDLSNIVFNRLEILGEEVKILPANRTERHRVVADSAGYGLPTHISYTNELTIDYSVRQFSLEFIDLGNMLSSAVKYTYKMEGLDDTWQNATNRNYVSYANLSPGNYAFKVKSQLSNGNWSNKIAELKIRIVPPFYKTWWFIMFEVMLTMALIFAGYRYLLKFRTYKLLEEKNERIKRANRQLKESEASLKVINATKDKFFSIVSHDLKNPFTSLLSISEMFKDSYDSLEDDERKDSIGRIHNSMKHIYNLLENLLTWSRAQSNRIQFNPANFNLSKVLQENYNLYSLAAEKKKIKLEAHFNDDIMAFGDREMINTVVRNLLNNALKFTPTGKKVYLEAKQIKNYQEVIVRDEGVGIPDENLKKLFRIDKKVKTVGTGGEKGTGLGLIICKEFVQKNHGEINIESEEGVGSTFSFTIPPENYPSEAERL
ncbi:MAG TPA: hypothetical protein DDX98_12190 [Bacteroidales bacterium]|jgi:signal transduction histidine kinase/ligand-binding sensor domain-containing protein|nr:hypothetical protein [Bacteroidales bacterium]